ncbi:hypothetical protein VNO77_30780 [Canavalia gladiata]|uniref:C2H2-type domain-containing protein n=1 Tax=Canavalia gladiata TaxID=3824 RepID=A0AAN9KRF0_CANGL
MNTNPAWLDRMLNEEFYLRCEIHGCQKFYFCVECCVSFCESCLYFHHSHRHFRVRQLSRRDMILLGDLRAVHVDCSEIKGYKNSTGKSDLAIFIRPTRPNRPEERINLNFSRCTCGMKMENPYRFCSLSCKFKGNENFQFAPTTLASSNAEAGSSSEPNGGDNKKKKVFGMLCF